MSHARKYASRLAALAVVVLAACQDATTPTAPSIPETPQAARSPQAQARLEAIFQGTKTDVMSIPGTIFADNDEVAGKVVYGVENAGVELAVRNRMARFGVDAADYDVQVTKPIVFAAEPTLRDIVRPVVAGLQIHFSRYVCSIGFNADKGTEASFITASHCTATQGGVEGTKYYQPTSSTPNSFIATEVDDPQYVKGGPGCPKGRKCRYSDASRARYEAGVVRNRGEIAKTADRSGSLTIAGTFTVTSQNNTDSTFTTGTVLNKVGRTTGWTQGNVDRTCMDTGVAGSTVYLFCQTSVRAGVNGGDSGSGVFKISSGDNVQVVGILWGGASDNSYFVFSPLKFVQRELGTLNAIK